MVGEIGVERIFPVMSPNIEKTVVKGHIKSKVRRAKLYHIRDKAAKEIRRQMRNIRALPDNAPSAEEVVEEAVAETPAE